MLWRLGRYCRTRPFGVFVSAAFPGVMRRGEVERGPRGPLERGVLVKLGAVVHGDGPHRVAGP
jgi:hypothetical protein